MNSSFATVHYLIPNIPVAVIVGAVITTLLLSPLASIWRRTISGDPLSTRNQRLAVTELRPARSMLSAKVADLSVELFKALASSSGKVTSDIIIEALRSALLGEVSAICVIAREFAAEPRIVGKYGVFDSRVEQWLLLNVTQMLSAFDLHPALNKPELSYLQPITHLGIHRSFFSPLGGTDDYRAVLWLALSCDALRLSDQAREYVDVVSQIAESALAAEAELKMKGRENDAQRSFFIGVSHDIRAPGHAALYALEELRRKLYIPDGPQRETISQISDAISEQLGMVGELLEFLKCQHGIIESKVTPFPLRPLIEAVVRPFVTLSESRNVSLTLETIPDWTVLFDRSHCRRILTNLVSNATKYTDSGSIRLSFERAGSIGEITVEDTGRGIEAEEERLLFQPYSRLSSSKASPGLGLGLALSRQFAELSNGYLYYRKARSGGSIFGFGVPLTSNNTLPKGEGSQQPIPYEHLQTALVVDDSCDTAKALARLVSRFSKKVFLASTVEEARAIIATEKPEMILSDLHILRRGAEEVFSFARSLSTPSLLFVVSGSADVERLNAICKAYGATVLEKPLCEEELRRALQTRKVA